MDLKIKSDTLLLSDLKQLVAKEREILTQVLHHLREIDSRKIYLARGFSSLFSFLTEEIGYPESAAQRRIQEMRLIREIPEVEEKIENGEISLTVAASVQSFLKMENQKRKSEQQGRLVIRKNWNSSRLCKGPPPEAANKNSPNSRRKFVFLKKKCSHLPMRKP